MRYLQLSLIFFLGGCVLKSRDPQAKEKQQEIDRAYRQVCENKTECMEKVDSHSGDCFDESFRGSKDKLGISFLIEKVFKNAFKRKFRFDQLSAKHAVLVFSLSFFVACGSEFKDEFEVQPAWETRNNFYDSANPHFAIEKLWLHFLQVNGPTDSEGKVIPDQRHYYVNHPLTITFGVTAKGPAFKYTTIFTLVETYEGQKSAEELRKLHICTLGAKRIEHPGSDSAGSATKELYSVRLVIPEDCLPDSEEKTFNFIITGDPEGTVTIGDEIEHITGSTVVYNRQHSQNLINQQCIDDHDNLGCVFDIKIEPSPGLNAEMSSLKLDSKVAHMKSSFDARHPYLKDGFKEVDTPFIRAQSTVQIFGATTDTEAKALGSGQTMTLTYDICPGGGVTDFDKSDCSGDDFEVLKIVQPGVDSQPILVDSVVLTEIHAATPNYFSHQLQLSPEAFAEINTGRWGDTRTFLLRACVTTNFTESETVTDFDLGIDTNNCKVQPFYVLNSFFPTEPDQMRVDYSTGRIWEQLFGDHKRLGGKIGISLQLNVSLERSIFRAGVTTFAHGWLDSRLFEYLHWNEMPNQGGDVVSKDIISVLGFPIYQVVSNQSPREDTQAQLLEGDYIKRVNHFFKGQSFRQQIGFPPILLDLKFRFAGELGINNNVGAGVVTVPAGGDANFTTATKVGELEATLEPFSNWFVSVGLARDIPYVNDNDPDGKELVGVEIEGKLKFAELKVPITAALRFGNEDPGLKFTTSLDATAGLQTLEGTVSFKLGLPAFTRRNNSFRCGEFGSLVTLPIPCLSFIRTKFVLGKWMGARYDYDLVHRNVPLITLSAIGTK